MQKTMNDFIGVSDMKNINILRQLIAEFLGTLLMVAVGICSTLKWDPQSPEPSILQIAITFGFMVTTVVYAIQHVSGGHINPAVTIGHLLVGNISLLKALCYILMQIVGAIAGAALITVAMPKKISGLGVTKPGANVTELQAMLIESLITFVLVLVVQGTSDRNHVDLQGFYSVGMGLAVTACHAGTWTFSGSSMNPARSIGPCVILGDWEHHWVYWAGPIVGSVLASFIYGVIFKISL